MYQHLLHFLNLLLLHKSSSTFTLPEKDFGSGKDSLNYTMSFFLPIQLLKQLS